MLQNLQGAGGTEPRRTSCLSHLWSFPIPNETLLAWGCEARPCCPASVNFFGEWMGFPLDLTPWHDAFYICHYGLPGRGAGGSHGWVGARQSPALMGTGSRWGITAASFCSQLRLGWMLRVSLMNTYSLFGPKERTSKKNGTAFQLNSKLQHAVLFTQNTIISNCFS